jgi:hypothetical protein
MKANFFNVLQALYEAQERLKQEVDGFRFMLGFSGWYYQHGTEEENIGDETLLSKYLMFGN